MIGPETRVVGVIGHPISHSRSPAIHNAAFQALSLDWAYVAFDVEPGSVPKAFAGVRALGIAGLSVTMPHKEAAAANVDEWSEAVHALGAVNTVVALDGGRLRGENTDAPGFLASLSDAGPSADPAGRRCLVRGAGGAARAVVWALAGAGAAEVVVVPGRDRLRAEATAALGGPLARVGDQSDLTNAHIVINATPLGLSTGHPTPASTMPVDVALLRAGQVVVDLVPRATTPLLEAATARGCTVVDGLGMLVHQAALAFTMWTGVAAPIDVMHRAARSRQ